MKVGNGAFTDMTKFDEDLGRALRDCRETKGFTQIEVAKKMNVSKMAVSLWESGKRSMTAENLKRYCQILDVPVQVILERT